MSIFFLFLFLLLLLPRLSTCSSQSLVYVGCTQVRFDPGTPYESGLDSALASLVNSASLSNYNTFTSGPVSALFQCRGDLPAPDCRACVAAAVARVGAYCGGACGGAMQLEGCFVKYDNASFVGAPDMTVVSSKCGPPAGGPDLEARRDAALASLGAGGGGQYFRAAGGGVAQCVQDLSAGQCAECLAEAAQRLRTECAASPWGDMFLGKCYVRYSLGGGGGGGGGYTLDSESERDDNDETEKTLALIIGVIAGVTLLIIFISFLGKSSDTKDG